MTACRLEINDGGAPFDDLTQIGELSKAGVPPSDGVKTVTVLGSTLKDPGTYNVVPICSATVAGATFHRGSLTVWAAAAPVAP